MTYPVQADVFAPTWLKTGVYAEYSFKSGVIHYPNASSSIGLGFDSYEFKDGILRWTCKELIDTKATVDVTFTYTATKYNGKALAENKTTQLTTEVYIDTLSRETYLPNGTLLGTSHLWLPANPSPTEDILLWGVTPDLVQSTVSNNTGMQVYSPQGSMKAFSVVKEATINNSTVLFNLVCYSKTGLLSQEVPVPVAYEPIYKALNILSFDVNGVMLLSNTNIDLGPSSEPFDWSIILPIAVVAAALIILGFTVYMRRSKRKRKKK